MKLTGEVVNVPPPKSAYPISRPNTDLGGAEDPNPEHCLPEDPDDTDEESPQTR